ncbi:MAG: hypothetical protein ACXU8U_08485 [Asticcacaulis sp.]
MRIIAASGLAVAAALMAAFAAPALAQDIAPAAPSNTMAVAAGDVAASAVAQVNDQADANAASQKVELYKQLMELNGMARNIRQTLDSVKTSTKLVIIQRSGSDHLTPDQDAKYDQVATSVLKDTETRLINNIAQDQAASFSADEIRQLITSNSSVAAAKYNAAKFSDQAGSAAQVQNYMVEAVVKIVKTFKASVAS